MNQDPVIQKHNYLSMKERKKHFASIFIKAIPFAKKCSVFFFHCIGKTRLKNLKWSYRTTGLASRSHGNLKCSPVHAISLSSTEFVVRFILNYAEQNGVLLPGRVPGYSRSDLKLLPSSVSKRVIWGVYQMAAEKEDDIHTIAYTTFYRVWCNLLPSIIIVKPMTDLCWQCQKHSSALLRSTNMTEEEKSDNLKRYEEHLRDVQVERSFYSSSCDECSRSVRAHFTTDSHFSPPPQGCQIPANSINISVHYNFEASE